MNNVRACIKANYITKDNTAPIYCRCYIDRNKVEIPCGTSVNVDFWDSTTGKVTRKDPDYKDKNTIINDVRARMSDITVRYRLRREHLSKEKFLKEYNSTVDMTDFYGFAKEYQRLRFKEIEASTAIYHQVVISKLRKFAPALKLSDLTEDFIREFAIWLRDENKNKPVTINKNLATIKIYVRDAVKRGLMKSNPFADIRLKRDRKEAEYLREEELGKLVALFRSGSLPENLQKALGFFLFMCFTSLHISDARAVSMEQIGKDSITYYRIKNRNSKPEPIVVPLSEPAKALIKKIAPYRVKGCLFEGMYPDQRINTMLKRIAKKCGIEKRISAKTGRHTFATIYLKRTHDLRTLQKILGHSSIQETMVYSHVLDEQPQDGIKVFNSYQI